MRFPPQGLRIPPAMRVPNTKKLPGSAANVYNTNNMSDNGYSSMKQTITKDKTKGKKSPY